MALVMLPGPKYLLLGGIVCSVALIIMGVCSYLIYRKEKQKRIAKWRAEKRAEKLRQAEQDMIKEAQQTVSSAPAPAPVPTPAPTPVVTEEPKPQVRSTRNDFDFKF